MQPEEPAPTPWEFPTPEDDDDELIAVGADLVPPELQTSKGFGDYIRKEYAASAEAAKIANLKPE